MIACKIGLFVAFISTEGAPVDSVFYPFFALMSQWMRPRFNVRMQLLAAQLRMLRSRVDTTRIVPTPEERAELIRLGASLDHDVDELMHIVQPETYRKWIRRLRKGTIFRMPRRPGIAKATRTLVLRIAGENLNWGHRRIVGELKKLGIRIGATTVRSILGREGHFPAPQKAAKNPPIPWTTFVHAHMDSMIACDFFTKQVLTLRGIRRAHVLVFLHLGSRRVFCSASTYHPDSAWVMQQARNATMWMESEGIDPRFIIRDRDRKYPDEFDTFWEESDVRPIRIPPRAPKANAFCESFIGITKREVLNHFVCFSQSQLDYIVREWLVQYHNHRPHRGVGKDNVVLDKEFVA